jgi:hypothetical protein
MLGQATAVLVSLSTLVTLQITSAAGFLAVLYQVLTFASTSHTRLIELGFVILVHIFHLVVFNGALVSIRLPADGHSDFVARQTSWWRWEMWPGRSTF